MDAITNAADTIANAVAAEYDSLVFEVNGSSHTMHVHIVHEEWGERTVIRIGFQLDPPKMRNLAMACMTFFVPDEAHEPIGLQWVGFESKCASPDLPEDGGSIAMTRAAIK